MTDTTSAAALQAELKRLEEELEKKKLEEEIRKLESQLQQQEGLAGEGEYYEVVEEEVVDAEEGEEYYEEVEEEVTEEYEEEVLPSSPEPSPKKERGPHAWGMTQQQQNAPAQPAAANNPQHQRSGAGKALRKSNPFTKALEEKKAAAVKKEQEKAARAEAAKPKSAISSSSAGGEGAGGEQQDGDPLPSLPPLKPRTIPKVPASSAGDETPMELLLGPKLYKQGKLIACSTVGGCQDMDLVLLYFGAGWQRECKLFVQQLLDFYTATTSTSIDGNDTNLEVIYISQDK